MCEDIDYFKNIISEINRDNCNEIKNYVEEQIKKIGPIYASSDTKYSDIIGYYKFTSFNKIDNIIERLKSKCPEVTVASPVIGDQGEMQHYSSRNSSIIAVTSLSGIVSSFFLLYEVI